MRPQVLINKWNMYDKGDLTGQANYMDEIDGEAKKIEKIIEEINDTMQRLFDTYQKYDEEINNKGGKLVVHKTNKKYTMKNGDIDIKEEQNFYDYNIFEKDCEIIDRIRKELNLQLFENPNFSGDIKLKDFINNRKFDKDKLLSKIDDFIKKEGLKQKDINKIFNSYEYDFYKKEIDYLIENEQSFLNRIVNEVLTGEDKLSFNLNQFVHWKKLENKPLQDIITSINNTSKEEFDTMGIDEVSVKAGMKEAILKYLLSVSVPDWLTKAGISREDILLSSQDNGFMKKLREELKQPGNVSLQDIIKNIDESIEQQEKIIEKIVNNKDESINNVKNEIKGKIKSYIEAKKDQVEGYIIPEFLTEAGISKRDIMLLEQNKDLKEELIKKLEPIGNIFDEKTTFEENDSLKNIIGKVLDFEYKKDNKNIKVEKLKEEVEKLEKTLQEITDDNKQVENKTKDDYIKYISTVKKQIKDMARENIVTRQGKLYKEVDEKKKKVIDIIKDLRKKNIEDGFYVPYWFGYYSNGNPINRADIKLLEADKKAVEDIFYTDYKAVVEMVNKIKGDTNFQKLINYIKFRFEHRHEFFKEEFYQENSNQVRSAFNNLLKRVNEKIEKKMEQSENVELVAQDTQLKKGGLLDISDSLIEFLEKTDKDFVNEIMSDIAKYMFCEGKRSYLLYRCLNVEHMICLLQNSDENLKQIAEIEESEDLKEIITKLDKLSSSNVTGKKMIEIIGDMRRAVSNAILKFGDSEIKKKGFGSCRFCSAMDSDGNWLTEAGIGKGDVILLKQNEEFKNRMSEIVKWLSDSKLTITGRKDKVYRLDELNLKDQDWFPKIIEIIDELLFQREDKSRQGGIKITEEKEIKGQIDQLSQEEKEKVKQKLIEDFKDFNLDKGDELYNIIGKIDEELNSREAGIEIKKQGIKKNLSKSIEELLVSSNVPLGLDNAGTVKQIEDAFNDVKETISKELEKEKKDFKTKFKDEIEGFRGWISGDKEEDIEEDIIMLLQDENFEKKFLEDIKSSYPKLGLTENVKIQDIVKNNGKFISQKMVDEREAEKSRKEGERQKVIDTINTIKNKAIKNKAIRIKEILKQEDNEDNEINTDMIIQKQENEDEDKTLQEQVKGILSNRVSGLISGQMHKSDSMVIGIEKMDGYPKGEEERKIYRDEKLAEIDNEIQLLIADNLLPIVNGEAEKMDMIKVAKSIAKKA